MGHIGTVLEPVLCDISDLVPLMEEEHSVFVQTPVNHWQRATYSKH